MLHNFCVLLLNQNLKQLYFKTFKFLILMIMNLNLHKFLIHIKSLIKFHLYLMIFQIFKQEIFQNTTLLK
jgi:hypothetical protein